MKSLNAAGAALSGAPTSSSLSATAATAAAAPAMSFNYPNMAGNEPQYLAILQNNAYPFPMPPHVGAQPAYRGPHAQAMPYFNGSFYSSQMLHPSQLQQQQQQQPPPSQSQQSQQGHPNTTISSGSSSSQKHLQNQQQRPHPSVVNGSSGSLQGFPASKNQPSQAIQPQQQQPQNLHASRQLEPEMGGEDSPSTADSRGSRANMSIFVLQNRLLNRPRTSIGKFSNACRTFISPYEIRFAHRQLRWTPFDLPEAPVLLDFSNSLQIGTILSKYRNYPFGSTERHIFRNI